MAAVNTAYQAQSNTPLGANAAYTSPILTTPAIQGTEVAEKYLNGQLRVVLVSDQASAAGGVVVSGSVDGATFHPIAAPVTLAANTPQTVSVPSVFNFYQIVVTNGTTAQTYFLFGAGFTI